MDAVAAGSPWTAQEIALVVESYFQLLGAELRGQPVNKAAANRALQGATGRSKGSIEFKHCNISAVLVQLRSFYIDGYKPRSNVQQSLRTAVERRLSSDSTLERLMLDFLAREPAAAAPAPRLNLAPAPSLPAPERHYARRAYKHDFVRLEAARRELGLAGERAVVDYERRRLRAAGQDALAARVEHVAVTQGDGLGFDVLSYDLAGAERFIEVKTTRRAARWPFVATGNEVALSREEPEKFSLFRVFHFGATAAGLFTLPGSLERSCALLPRDFDAYPR